MVQLKMMSKEPCYPVKTFDRQPVGITAHKGQFFVIFDNGRLEVFTKEFEPVETSPGIDFSPGCKIHFNKGNMNIVNETHPNRKVSVSVYKR